MSTPTVLQTSPEELRRAARLLQGLGGEVEGLAERTAAAAGLGGGWQGVAALQQEARAAALRELVRRAAGPVREVSSALGTAADTAESAGSRVRAWTGRLQDCHAELMSLRMMGPPPDPLLEASWRRRLQEIEQETQRCQVLIEEAEREWLAAQGRVAATLAGAWTVVGELQGLREAFEPVVRLGLKVRTGVAQMVHSTRWAIAMARATWARSAAVRAVALQRVRSAMSAFFRTLTGSKELTLLRKVRLVPGPVGWALTWLGATQEVRTGAGYTGWRGGITRGLAGATLVAGPMLLIGPLIPPAGLVGVTIMTTYQFWLLGNTLYDQWPAIARYARLGWDQAVRGAVWGARHGPDLARRAAVRAVQRLSQVKAGALGTAAGFAVRRGHALQRVREDVGGALQDVRSRVVGLPPGVTGKPLPDAEDVVRTLGGLVSRMPDTSWLRERLRQAGEPLRLPAAPLGPTLRAPIDLGTGWGPGRADRVPGPVGWVLP